MTIVNPRYPTEFTFVHALRTKCNLELKGFAADSMSLPQTAAPKIVMLSAQANRAGVARYSAMYNYTSFLPKSRQFWNMPRFTGSCTFRDTCLHCVDFTNRSLLVVEGRSLRCRSSSLEWVTGAYAPEALTPSPRVVPRVFNPRAWVNSSHQSRKLVCGLLMVTFPAWALGLADPPYTLALATSGCIGAS